MEYLSELKAAIRSVHGCDAMHMATTPVKELFQGRAAWEGEVETFDLVGHPRARRCYAWGYPDSNRGDKLKVVTVLEIPPVVSPQTAVRAAIAATAKGL